MYEISLEDESYAEPMPTDIFKDIRYGSQYHLSINRSEERYKIRYRIKQNKEIRKGSLLSTRNMDKGFKKVFKAVVNDILQDLPILGESGSEVYYFITEPINFAEVNRLSKDITKTFLKATLKEIKM